MSHIAVVGGGICGLSAAIRLSQCGANTELWEVAKHPGGRTNSYFEQKTETFVDHGPHLITGAYQATLALLREAGAESNVYLQPSLSLPLWDRNRSHFSLKPLPSLPLPIALPISIGQMPEHGLASAIGMLRLAAKLNGKVNAQISVRDWLASIKIPDLLYRDLLEVICLGAMNEAMNTANAASFARVLRDSFKNHDTARLGWFRAPLKQALVDPLISLARSSGTIIRLGSPVRSLIHENGAVAIVDREGNHHRYDKIILTLPPWQRNRLLKTGLTFETRSIVNAHFWFESDFQLPTPLIGTLGTRAHWWFDIETMHGQSNRSFRHLCAVISADEGSINGHSGSKILLRELSELLGSSKTPLNPVHSRMIIHRRATSLVHAGALPKRHSLPMQIIDAGEAPEPGQLPATIEAAVRRGERAANIALGSEIETVYPL